MKRRESSAINIKADVDKLLSELKANARQRYAAIFAEWLRRWQADPASYGVLSDYSDPDAYGKLAAEVFQRIEEELLVGRKA